MIIIGFDPGGANQFGWCISQGTSTGADVIRSGTANHAAGAISALTEFLGAADNVVAAGIDSPLFWVAGGNRHVDNQLRRAIRNRGAPHSAGTVQQVNSLRGACLTQGILAAHLLRRRWPKIRLTEAHPKALLWLLGVACPTRHVSDIAMSEIPGLTCRSSVATCEHERDAALGTLTASAMLASKDGWRDLRPGEPVAFEPVEQVEYWMPLATSA